MEVYDIVDDLISGRKSIGIIGAGFIGTATALFYAQEGVKSVLYDIDVEKVEMYERGFCNVVNLEQWSQLNLKKFVDEGIIFPTTKFTNLKDIDVFFVAVPTEKGGEPFDGYIKTVLAQLMTLNPKLIVIESTMCPSWVSELSLKDFPVCVAIRRDWFSSPEFTVKTIPRIYCAINRDLNILSERILSIVSEKVIKASSMETTSLVKAVENAIRHVELVSVQELAMVFDRDIDEVLELVATHPQRVRYYPNIKVGGYCVPLGSKYVRDSADHPNRLKLFLDAIEQNESTPGEVVMKQLGVVKDKVVGVLGITYKNDLRVHTLSPGMAIIDEFKTLGNEVLVHDGFYFEEDVEKITGCKYLKYPEDMEKCDIIVVTIDHKEYYRTPLWVLEKHLSRKPFILDNLGVWKRYGNYLNNYHRFGAGKKVK